MGGISSTLNRSDVSPGTFRDAYALSDTVIGHGAFAKVQLCTHRVTGEVRAAKLVSKRQGEADVLHIRASPTRQYLQAEVRIMRTVGTHPNILDVFDVFETRRKVVLVLELATGGTLTARLRELGVFTESIAADVVRQVASALEYLHGRGIVHRDIKLDNLLLKEPQSFVVKVIDFGIAKVSPPDDSPKRLRWSAAPSAPSPLRDQAVVLKSTVGTSGYMAPELLELMHLAETMATWELKDAQKAGTAGVYDSGIDVWALGIVMAIMVTGASPVDGRHAYVSQKALIESSAFLRLDEPRWAPVSEACKALLRQMLDPERSNRASATDVLRHTWVGGGAPPSTPLPLSPWGAAPQRPEGGADTASDGGVVGSAGVLWLSELRVADDDVIADDGRAEKRDRNWAKIREHWATIRVSTYWRSVAVGAAKGERTARCLTPDLSECSSLRSGM
jgi:serine/threonine protein kinase